ncbi:multicopper oxidase domain-containing protein [Amycolatopsis keratiniphila]|uniref:multicopper oxidase domain-containing protein n=1 Tax=Amycolatopsis keratiniphila TaxID=129921 RepID=UPI0033D46A88
MDQTPRIALAPPTAARPQGPLFVWANAVVLGWLAVAVILSAAHEVLGLPSWVALHALLLGAVTNAIVIWSEHFVVTLCRAPAPPARRVAAGLIALNLSVVTVLAGVTTDVVFVTGAGAAGICVIATVHAVSLLRTHRKALQRRFGHLVGFYASASVALLAGAVTGAALGTGVATPVWYLRLWGAHVHLTLLGWVGFAVLGTLFTLWPTALGTRIADGTASATRRALPMLAVGLVLAVGGILSASQWLTLAGLVWYTAGVGIAMIPLVRALGTRRPRGPAAWMLAAGTGWLGVAVVFEAVRLLVTGSVDAVPDVVGAVVPVFVLGFTVQVLVGTLTQLLPVVLGRGPVEHKALSAALARGWQVRVLLTNLAVPLVAGDWPRPLPLIGWAFGALGVGTFVVLALRATIPVALRGAVTTVQEPDRVSPAAGTTTGIAAGLGVVVLAVALATTGTTEAPDTPASDAAHTVEVTMSAMRIRPSTVDIPPGTRLVLRVTNQDSMPHDLRADGGQRTPRLRQGETALLDLGEIRGDHQAWCDVAGHRAAGMTMTIRTSPAAADTGQDDDPGTGNGLDLGAAPSPGWTPRDARLSPPTGTVHRVELHVTEQDLEVAPGVRERRWTFGRTAPGPALRGRVGDRFEITLVNDAAMGHGIDFHAGALAPDQPMRTIEPGERLVYRFTAHRAGAWLYHCSTMPMSQHIANGMYGAVVIDPPDLPAADHEYLLVSSQLYLGAPDSDQHVAKIHTGRPDGWAFNGTAAQYDHAPLTAHTGRRVRIWLVNAGPGDATAFHVVGAQFDTLYKEGTWLLRPGDPGGAQVLDLAPAQGGFVELTFPEAGHYPFVDHDMRHAENGAHGQFTVTEPPR